MTQNPITEEEVWQEFERKLKINTQPPTPNNIIKSLFEQSLNPGVRVQTRDVPIKNSSGFLLINRFRWSIWTFMTIVPLAKDRCDGAPDWQGDLVRLKYGNTLVWAAGGSVEDLHRIDRRQEFLPLIKLSSPQAFWDQWHKKQRHTREFLDEWARLKIDQIRARS